MIKVKISNKKVIEKITEKVVTPDTSHSFRTFGELRQVLDSVRMKERAKKIAGFSIGAILAIPGMEMAKTTFDVIKAAYNAADDKKTNSYIDKFNVDDEYSKIVDKKIEEDFLKYIYGIIQSEPADKQIPHDFNINKKLQDFLKDNYKNRTLTYSSK